MTIEKLKELLQIRVDYFEQRLADEAMTAQLKAYTANLGTVPDEVAEPAFWAALGKCRYPKQFLVDWQDAVREIMRKRLPSDAALWSETMDAAHRISDCYAVHANGGYAGEAKGERLEAARQIFDGLPAMVQRWAGSPRELCDLVNHNTKSELNKFTRPGFNKMLANAPLMDLEPAQSVSLLNPASAAKSATAARPPDRSNERVHILTDPVRARKDFTMKKGFEAFK